MNIKKQPASVTVTFSPNNYWLRKTVEEDDRWEGAYCLTVRIPMDYAGKPDQEGAVVMFLSDEEARLFRDAGFDEIE